MIVLGLSHQQQFVTTLRTCDVEQFGLLSRSSQVVEFIDNDRLIQPIDTSVELPDLAYHLVKNDVVDVERDWRMRWLVSS